MLQNAYFLAKLGADTADNEQHFAEIFAEIVPPRRRRRRRRTSSLQRTELTAAYITKRRLAKFRQNVARFRLSRLRFLQENMRVAAFFKIYQILKLKFLKFYKILQILRHLQFVKLLFAEISRKLLIFQTDFLRKFGDCSGAKVCKSCRA